MTDARGSTYQRICSAEGWVTGATDPLGYTTSYGHDPLGRVVREIDPLEQITQTAYDQAGRVTRQWTPDGALWRYGYVQMGAAPDDDHAAEPHLDDGVRPCRPADYDHRSGGLQHVDGVRRDRPGSGLVR